METFRRCPATLVLGLEVAFGLSRQPAKSISLSIANKIGAHIQEGLATVAFVELANGGR